MGKKVGRPPHPANISRENPGFDIHTTGEHTMKKLVFALVLAVTACGGAALAQDFGVNNIGVYFDAEGTQMSNSDGTPGPRHVYVVLTNLDRTVVNGFECKITASGGMLVSYDSMAFPVDVIDVGTRYGEVIAGFGQPLMVSEGRAVVMEFDIIVTDADIPGLLFIDPIYFSSIPGSTAFLSDGEIVAARNATAAGFPVLVTNSEDEPVGAQATSFDNLKSLYR
jgi:hypothetical protein